MPVTLPIQLELERTKSHYGCGADTCQACYPLQYGCDNCFAVFVMPIANGERYECDRCNWVNNADTY
jgi:hypothetical protein